MPRPGQSKKSFMKEEMGKYKRGELHSGSKTGPVVRSRKQALAIGLNQIRRHMGKRAV